MFHQIDPRTKIIISGLAAILVVILKNPYHLFFLYLLFLIFYLLIKPPKANNKLIMFLTASIVIGTMISQGFFYYFEPKTKIFTILPGLSLCREGIFYGAIQSLRMLVVLMVGFVIVLTTHPSDLIFALTRFKLPEKASFMLTLSIRFLPSLLGEARRILIAQQLRGLKLKGIKGTVKSFYHLSIPLVINSLRTARKIALAAEVRGFSGRRNSVKESKFSLLDGTVFLFFFTIFLLLIYFK